MQGKSGIERANTEHRFKFCSQCSCETTGADGCGTTLVTESWIATYAGSWRWLRGRDLNPGPLGYEPNLSMARLCLSMICLVVVCRFSTLFWGILFSICSSIVLRFWPNGSPTTLGIGQEKSPTTQITVSFYRQISTIAADLIGMIGCPRGP